MTIDAAYVGFIVALLGAGGVIVWAVANFLKTQLQTLNDLVNDLRKEVADLRKQDQDKELEIRELLKQSADIPRLQLQIFELRAQIQEVKAERERDKEQLLQREVERDTAKKSLELAEARISDMQTAFVKERAEWQAERGKLNSRITELTRQVEQHDARIGSVEQDMRQTPKQELPAVKTDGEEAA